MVSHHVPLDLCLVPVFAFCLFLVPLPVFSFRAAEFFWLVSPFIKVLERGGFSS